MMDKNKWISLLCILFVWGCGSDAEGKGETDAEAAGKIENLAGPAAAISADGKAHRPVLKVRS